MTAHIPPPKVSTRQILLSAVFILLWYFFSLTLSLYNKWMFSPSNLDFQFPILVTAGHQTIQFVLAFLTMALVPKLRPKAVIEAQFTGTAAKWWLLLNMGLLPFARSIAPCSLASSGDIGMGNMSFRYISLTFYTMIKSSSLAFVLIFSFMFKLEKPNVVLIAIIAVMTAGVVMMVAGGGGQNVDEEGFALGFLLVLSAACLSGLRWALTQLLLRTNSYTSNPFATIFYIAPLMAGVLFVVGAVVEGLSEFAAGGLWDHYGLFRGIGLLIIPGVLAFLMTLSEFALLQHASVLTLSIAGIFKELLTISTSTVVFRDRLTLVNILGLLVTLAAIIAYNAYRLWGVGNSEYEKIAQEEAGELPDASRGSSVDSGRPIPAGDSFELQPTPPLSETGKSADVEVAETEVEVEEGMGIDGAASSHLLHHRTASVDS